MDNRTIIKAVLLLTAATLFAAGCDNPNKVLAHSADEQKAIDVLKNETPEQQIKRIEDGPMPQSAKGPMIQKIKDKYGLK